MQERRINLNDVTVAKAEKVPRVMVGVFFGYSPAQRAAGLDPVEALRYE